MDSVVSGGVPDQWKQALPMIFSNKKELKKIYKNFKSDSENKAANFPRLIVPKSLEETC